MQDNLENINYDIKESMALNPNTPSEILALLAKEEDWSVRYYVAKHPNISPETLTLLAKDDDSYISEAAFKNPNLPNEYKMLHLMEN